MPILSSDGIKRMTELSAAKLPEGLVRELDARRGDDEAVGGLGVAYATLQSAELLAGGAPGIHFLTLNRSPATRAILSALKLQRPWEQAKPRAERSFRGGYSPGGSYPRPAATP
ncbi:MAG: methylenetetrahydrofolate reductase, partial [Solirubrobacteraceae bacterium]